MEEYVHAEREVSGPLPVRGLRFVRGRKDEFPEELAVPFQDGRGHVNARVRHVRGVSWAHLQEFQNLAVPATPVDDTRDAVVPDEVVDVPGLVVSLFAFRTSAGRATFAVPAVPVTARSVVGFHFVTPGTRTPTFGPGFASARRPACFSTLMISPVSASAVTAASTPGLVSVS